MPEALSANCSCQRRGHNNHWRPARHDFDFASRLTGSIQWIGTNAFIFSSDTSSYLIYSHSPRRLILTIAGHGADGWQLVPESGNLYCPATQTKSQQICFHTSMTEVNDCETTICICADQDRNSSSLAISDKGNLQLGSQSLEGLRSDFVYFNLGDLTREAIPGTLRIPFLGNLAANVATVSAVPSYLEFLEGRNGYLRSSADKRVLDQDTLKSSIPDIPQLQAEAIFDSCLTYFEKNPLLPWFEKLQNRLLAPLGLFYATGEISHLHLSPHASMPGSEPSEIDLYANLRSGFSGRLLGDSHFKVLLMNGYRDLDLLLAYFERCESVQEYSGENFNYKIAMLGNAPLLAWEPDITKRVSEQMLAELQSIVRDLISNTTK